MPVSTVVAAFSRSHHHKWVFPEFCCFGRAPRYSERTEDPMLTTVLLLIVGLVLLVASAEFLVRGAARLAAEVGISPLVVGLTVVAYGTSAPELAVSVMSSFNGQPDIALGNIVGSNIFNVLVILGLAALITPLVVAQQLVRFDVPVMIGISFLVFVFGYDGNVGRIEGLILFSGAVAYTTYLIRQSRRESRSETGADESNSRKPASSDRQLWLKNIALILVGVGGLVIGSKLLVDGAVMIARHFGVSELIIGLTIISAGTSLPEVATSVVAAMRGERDIAVGNVVGSNIFNILCVLGLASLVSPSGVSVSKQALLFDVPVMIAIAVGVLPVFFSGYQISRLNGAVFLTFYAAYLVYLFLYGTSHESLGGYKAALIYGVAPITAMTLCFVTWQSLKSKSSVRNGS
jgi:cation:H+ antiporter